MTQRIFRIWVSFENYIKPLLKLSNRETWSIQIIESYVNLNNNRNGSNGESSVLKNFFSHCCTVACYDTIGNAMPHNNVGDKT